MVNTGKEYEEFVRLLHQALMDSEPIAKQKNIVVQSDKKIVDNCGIERQFDIYWEYELAGITYKTVIECKDYKSNVSVDKIDALIGKIRDLPDIKALFATKKGYQEGAQKKADHNKIDLLIVRKQNDFDWTDAEGNPFIKELALRGICHFPAELIDFIPLFDVDWMLENSNHVLGSEVFMSGLNNEIFIENEDSNSRFSLYDLISKLSTPKNKYGIYTDQVRFTSGWVLGENFRYKIKGYNLKYMMREPYKIISTLDFSKELIGVIEYLHKGTKKSIFKNGKIRTE